MIRFYNIILAGYATITLAIIVALKTDVISYGNDHLSNAIAFIIFIVGILLAILFKWGINKSKNNTRVLVTVISSAWILFMLYLMFYGLGLQIIS